MIVPVTFRQLDASREITLDICGMSAEQIQTDLDLAFDCDGVAWEVVNPGPLVPTLIRSRNAGAVAFACNFYEENS